MMDAIRTVNTAADYLTTTPPGALSPETINENIGRNVRYHTCTAGWLFGTIGHAWQAYDGVVWVRVFWESKSMSLNGGSPDDIPLFRLEVL